LTDIVWIFGGKENKNVPIFGTYNGHDGVVELFDKVKDFLEVKNWHIKEFVAQDDKVVIVINGDYVVKKTGKACLVEEIHYITVKDFKIRQVKVFFDFNAIYEAWF